MSTANIIYRTRISAPPNAVAAIPSGNRRLLTQNSLLDAFPADVYEGLRPSLVPVTLSFGEIVYERGERPECVYFPVSAVVSLLYTTVDGSSAEMGMAGKDGVVGVARFLGGDSTTNQAMVQTAGRAFKMPARLLQAAFTRSSPVQRVLLRYIQAFLTQVSQTSVCNRLHPVDKRLCRWLLLSHERAQSDRLSMTQEFISNMLGSRRESVTIAAARLQDAGLIHYSRGHITILDRAGLELAACECYRTVKAEYDRLLSSRAGADFNI